MKTSQKMLLALSIAGLFLTASAQQGATPAKSANKNVHQIDLPDLPPKLPAGPHADTFENRCTLCHSARYVAMQPRFPKAVWEKEVKKMVDAYGAPITTEEQVQIVEYLVAIKGPQEK